MRLFDTHCHLTWHADTDPPAERIARARSTLEAIRRRAPDIRTTTALGPKGAAALGSMYDVWIGCSSPEMIEKCLAMGKRPWTYSCRDVTEVSPAWERLFFGRFAWKIGLKGVGLWSYAEDDSFFDRFGRKHGYGDGFVFTPEWRQQYGHVMFEDGGIVPSVTWEAVREGIDDYRYMLTLHKLASEAAASDSAGRRAAAADGLNVLKDIAARVDTALADDRQYGRKWEAVGDADADRTRVIEAILRLQQGPS